MCDMFEGQLYKPSHRTHNFVTLNAKSMKEIVYPVDQVDLVLYTMYSQAISLYRGRIMQSLTSVLWAIWLTHLERKKETKNTPVVGKKAFNLIFRKQWITDGKRDTDWITPCFTKCHDVINGNIFCVTGLLCGEFTGDRWITRTKASDAEL